MPNIVIDRGDSATLQVSVLRAALPLDLRPPGTQLTFTAKRNAADADSAAVIRKGYGIIGLSGITIVNDGSGIAKVALAPADTDGLGPDLVFLVYDVQLVQPDTTRTTVARGTLVIRGDVSRT